MSNTDQNDSKRPRVAEHAWINAAGEKVESIVEATGNRTTFLATGKSVDGQTGGKPGKAVTMFAAFGIRTLMVNRGSQARTAGEDEADFVTATLAEIKDGNWYEYDRGGGGPRYDFDLLAQAIVEVKTNAGIASTTEEIRAKLDGEDGYPAKAMRNTEVAAIYNRLKGRPTPTANDL